MAFGRLGHTVTSLAQAERTLDLSSILSHRSAAFLAFRCILSCSLKSRRSSSCSQMWSCQGRYTGIKFARYAIACLLSSRRQHCHSSQRSATWRSALCDDIAKLSSIEPHGAPRPARICPFSRPTNTVDDVMGKVTLSVFVHLRIKASIHMPVHHNQSCDCRTGWGHLDRPFQHSDVCAAPAAPDSSALAACPGRQPLRSAAGRGGSFEAFN